MSHDALHTRKNISQAIVIWVWVPPDYFLNALNKVSSFSSATQESWGSKEMTHEFHRNERSRGRASWLPTLCFRFKASKFRTVLYSEVLCAIVL